MKCFDEMILQMRIYNKMVTKKTFEESSEKERFLVLKDGKRNKAVDNMKLRDKSAAKQLPWSHGYNYCIGNCRF